MSTVYSTPQGFFVTGVGRRDDRDIGIYPAPSDPSKRWDDDDYVPQPDDGVAVMRSHTENGIHGFVLHESCWNLLLSARINEPEGVPLHRFVQACESLPFTGLAINIFWGHTYGGLCEIERDGPPWYGKLTDPLYELPVGEEALHDPFHVPELASMLDDTSGPPEPIENPVEVEICRKPLFLDCFGKLPWELREAIAIHLLTEDALNLRRASRAFYPLMRSQPFWASRFQRSGERGFIFEAQNSPQRRVWSELYSITGASCPSGLRHRRRIWPLVQELSQILSLRPSETLDSCQPTHKENWASVTGEIVQEPAPLEYLRFQQGCRLLSTNYAMVPSHLTWIAISTVGSGDNGYISGINFISGRGSSEVCLGYKSEGNEVFLQVSSLAGFILAMGPGGLKALKIVDANNKVSSRWVGSPINTPISERLVQFESIEAVKVGVDVSLHLVKSSYLIICELIPTFSRGTKLSASPQQDQR